MSAPKILISYVTTDGHTRKVATRIAGTLEESDLEPVVAELDGVPDPLETEGFDGVILAAPVRVGRHPREMRRFVSRNRDALDGLPSAFVSVSGAAGAGDPEGLDEAEGYVQKFIDKTGWSPDRTSCVGGAVAYTKYNPLVRRIMKAISARKGGSTDTSRDHEYTDWKAVDGFTRDFARLVRDRRSTV